MAFIPQQRVKGPWFCVSLEPSVWATNLESLYTHYAPYTNKGPYLQAHKKQERRGCGPKLGPMLQIYELCTLRFSGQALSKLVIGTLAERLRTLPSGKRDDLGALSASAVFSVETGFKVSLGTAFGVEAVMVLTLIILKQRALAVSHMQGPE